MVLDTIHRSTDQGRALHAPFPDGSLMLSKVARGLFLDGSSGLSRAAGFPGPTRTG